MPEKKQQFIFEARLNDFDPEARRDALISLLKLAETGEIALPPEQEIANLHCHTFYSFNGYGYSPTAIAWLAKKMGIKFMGIVDFDVLDGVEEFLDACEVAGVRGSAGMETRVFIPEFATREINSPGEPGISYHMGIGFTEQNLMGDAQAILDDMRARAETRTRDMADRINAYLSPVAICYEEDVLPLTPNGNATERHLLTAFVDAVARKTKNPAAFWAEKLSVSEDEIVQLQKNLPRLKDLIRKKLMKRGGVGYVQPGPSTFPSVDEAHTMILAAGALPCITWLDGTSEGEQNIRELIELLISKGAVAVNVVPDRNWNITDPLQKAEKVKNLYDLVSLADEFHLPLNIGTEMNAYGLKLVDDFSAPELQPVKDAFLAGAYFIYGHTLMNRYAGMGYMSEWAQQHLPTRKMRNEFFSMVAKLIEPGLAAKSKLASCKPTMEPNAIISYIQKDHQQECVK
ncbi:MAG: hypothetical protein HPY85_04835 [Anaerolineae bacterium]|nr:hypothetical protein [Anaerolineae bacterium]